MRRAEASGVAVTVFPELSLTGYTCGDLLLQGTLLEAAEAALAHLVDVSAELQGAFVVGLPVEVRGSLYNCAAVVSRGKIVGVVPKSFLSDHGASNQKRWFATGVGLYGNCIRLCGCEVPFGRELIFTAENVNFGVEIGEDAADPQAPDRAGHKEGQDGERLAHPELDGAVADGRERDGQRGVGRGDDRRRCDA